MIQDVHLPEFILEIAKIKGFSRQPISIQLGMLLACFDRKVIFLS
jgi:hypothetical protein